MSRHNNYLYTTLQHLGHVMEGHLENIVLHEPSPTPLPPQQCKPNPDTVHIQPEMQPSLLTPSTQCGTLSTMIPHAPTLTHTLPSTLHPQPPCAIPCLLHQQAPYKIHVVTPPSTQLPSWLLPMIHHDVIPVLFPPSGPPYTPMSDLTLHDPKWFAIPPSTLDQNPI